MRYPSRFSTLPEQHHLTASDEQYDSVIVGLAPEMFCYDHLNAAFRVLLPTATNPARPLIATHRAKYIRTPSKDASMGLETLSLGPGPFVAALEAATGGQAEVVGKPSRTFFETVIASFKLGRDPGNTGKIVIVGDDIETDLGGAAKELGLWRVLGSPLVFPSPRGLMLTACSVKTGKYRPGDEHRPGVAPPDEVCDSFATFVDSLLEHR